MIINQGNVNILFIYIILYLDSNPFVRSVVNQLRVQQKPSLHYVSSSSVHEILMTIIFVLPYPKNMFHLLLTTTLTTATAHTFLPTASLTKGRTELPLKTYPTINPDDLPVSFDARVAWPKCTSIYEIYDQSNCGDCWAVSSVSAMCFI